MTNILDDQVDELLRKAEQRLRHDAVAVSPSHTHSAAELKPSVSTSAGKSSTQQKDLAVRAPIPTLKGPRTQARVSCSHPSPLLHAHSSAWMMLTGRLRHIDMDEHPFWITVTWPHDFFIS